MLDCPGNRALSGTPGQLPDGCGEGPRPGRPEYRDPEPPGPSIDDDDAGPGVPELPGPLPCAVPERAMTGTSPGISPALHHRGRLVSRVVIVRRHVARPSREHAAPDHRVGAAR